MPSGSIRRRNASEVMTSLRCLFRKAIIGAGITNGRVFRNAQDPNDIVILQDVADVAKARTWLGSNDMKATMQKSGVVGSPNVRFAAAA